MRIVGSGYNLEEAERSGCCISLPVLLLVCARNLQFVEYLHDFFSCDFGTCWVSSVAMRPSTKSKTHPKRSGGETSGRVILA